MGEERRKDPTKVGPVENLVLTEKDDLGEDKYHPQVKTSDFPDKESKEQ